MKAQALIVAREIGRLPIYLKPQEVANLLQAIPSPRDLLITRLLYLSALRISEALGLCFEDIDFQDHVIRVCHAITRSGLPKGMRERLVPIDPQTLTLILAYAGERSEGRLFQVTTRQVQRLIKAYAREAGIRGWKRVTPHKLRHSFAIHWVQRGGDLERLRRILGHRSLETTQVYLQFRFQDVRLEYDRIMGGGRALHE